MITLGSLTITWIGALCGGVIFGAIVSTLYWMTHPPKSKADIVAKRAETQLQKQFGTTVVVFSSEIRSDHMMVLASRIARGQRTELLAVYVIEVPFTLPTTAPMDEEDRQALDVLAAAEVIAKKSGIDVRTEIVHHRQTSQAVLEIAKREKADLLILGSYREGRYAGAPLSRTIELIAADAKCDVLIGVEGKHGSLLESDQGQIGTPTHAS